MVIWTLAIFAAQLIARHGYSLLDTWRLFHASNVDSFMMMDRMALYTTYFIVDLLLFWGFASRTRDQRLRHILATVILLHAIQSAIDYFLVGKPGSELLRPSLTGRLLLAAALGFGLASFRRTDGA